MKYNFIVYIFGIMDVDIFLNKFGETLQSLTWYKSNARSKKDRWEYLVFLFLWAISKFREDIYAYLCFQAFPKQFTDDYLSNHLYGQEARKVFIQHPRYNIEVFLKRTKDGRSIIHRHWPKVARTFNIIEGSIFAFRFSSFPDEIHLSIYRLWC
jgi:hypothetical protein